MSKVILFPPTKQDAAEAYRAKSDEVFAALYPEPGLGTFNYDAPRIDAHGNWVVAYLGPDFKLNGVDVPEPDEMIPYRVDGAVTSTVDWPQDW